MPFSEYQTVRIRELLRDEGAYDPFGSNRRAPRAGETGTVVDVPRPGDADPVYTVERARPDGMCVWLAEFQEQELEGVDADPPAEAALPPDPDPRDERPGALLVASIVVRVAVLLAALAAAGYGLFIVWPPASAWAAGARAAVLLGGFLLVGGLATGQRLGESLIGATLVALVAFALGVVLFLSTGS